MENDTLVKEKSRCKCWVCGQIDAWQDYKEKLIDKANSGASPDEVDSIWGDVCVANDNLNYLDGLLCDSAFKAKRGNRGIS